jgi:hypothetical protein
LSSDYGYTPLDKGYNFGFHQKIYIVYHESLYPSLHKQKWQNSENLLGFHEKNVLSPTQVAYAYTYPDRMWQGPLIYQRDFDQAVLITSIIGTDHVTLVIGSIPAGCSC